MALLLGFITLVNPLVYSGGGHLGASKRPPPLDSLSFFLKRWKKGRKTCKIRDPPSPWANPYIRLWVKPTMLIYDQKGERGRPVLKTFNHSFGMLYVNLYFYVELYKQNGYIHTLFVLFTIFFYSLCSRNQK